MSILEQQLDRVVATGELVEIHRDNLTAESLTGVVLAAGRLVVVALVDEGLDYDGVTAVCLGDVTRLSSGSPQLAVMQRQVRELQGLSVDARRIAAGTIIEAARALQAAFGYVAVFTETMSDEITVIGEILESDDDYLLLREGRPLGSGDRPTLVVHTSLVPRVQADGRYERTVVRSWIAS